MQSWKSTIGAIRFPLGFYGLALLVLEGLFSARLFLSDNTEQLNMVILLLMSFCFIVTVLTVSYLVLKVPVNLMLEKQSSLNKEIMDFKMYVDIIEMIRDASKLDQDNLTTVKRIVKEKILESDGGGQNEK